MPKAYCCASIFQRPAPPGTKQHIECVNLQTCTREETRPIAICAPSSCTCAIRRAVLPKLPFNSNVRPVFHFTEEDNMLQLRPNCECCAKNLPPESTEARICSFECTFCESCATNTLAGQCPNCGGELLTRPRRPLSKLAKYPASTERIVRPNGCHEAA